MRINSPKSEIEERSERAECQKTGQARRMSSATAEAAALETSIALTTAQLEGEKDSDAQEEECREEE